MLCVELFKINNGVISSCFFYGKYYGVVVIGLADFGKADSLIISVEVCIESIDNSGVSATVSAVDTVLCLGGNLGGFRGFEAVYLDGVLPSIAA